MKKDILNNLYNLAKDISPVAGARVVAAIYKRKKLISLGYCQYKTHPLQAKFGEKYSCLDIHAEISAIVNAPRDTDFSKCTLYIARAKKDSITKEWKWGMAKPCKKGCSQALVAFGFKNVVFTIDETGEYDEY